MAVCLEAGERAAQPRVVGILDDSGAAVRARAIAVAVQQGILPR